MTGREVYLVDGVRTPVGRFGGALASVRPDDLAAQMIRRVLERAGVPFGAVDEVVLGAANQAGEDNRNLARMALLLAGLPVTVPGYTVNRLCASGLQAVASAAASIRGGENDLVVAGGAESMTRAPWVMAKPGTPWARPGEVVDSALGWRFINPRMPSLDGGEATISLGETAEKVAREEGITRADCDAWALLSQTRAADAWAAGRFDAEVDPVVVAKGQAVTKDETVRDSSAEGLAALQPAFVPGGVVTAGNASPLSDGASAIVVASADAVTTYGLRPRARVVASTAVGVAPSTMGLGPVPAIAKLLERTGLALGDVGAIEINEAFAAQVIACERRLGLDPRTLNADGGAIALGHPLGSSGSRLLVTLLGRMERDDVERGIVALCIGVGQGAAMLVERS